MRNPYNLTGNPNRSNRGSANGPPRQPVVYELDRICPAVARSIGFNNLITFQNTADPSTTLLF